MPTLQDLQYFQAMPLSMKVDLTRNRIRDWVREYGEDGCYISFSGGKDSTVLLDLVRNYCGYKKVPAMFVDVPTQYPELKEFVETFDNVDIVKPKISFAQVCEKYGFPLISKEVSGCVEGARKYLTSLMNDNTILKTDRQTDRQTDINIDTDKLSELINASNQKGEKVRLAMLLGMLTKDNKIKGKSDISDDEKSDFSKEKYKFFLDAPFEISSKCCNIMKKDPAHKYHKETGRVSITATMASESRLRTQKWLQNGCNGFDLKIPTSNPMSFWTEQDVLLYIKKFNLPICSVYGDIIPDYDEMGIIEGQMSITDYEGFENLELFDKDNVPLKTTGCSRTGCVLCGFGCHLESEKESRFRLLKETHPKFYALLDLIKNNGMTYREAIEWYNDHCEKDRNKIWL